MKVCIIQPPYEMTSANADALFETKLRYLEECDPSMDIIVLPEYSDVPYAAKTWEETYGCHTKYIDKLLTSCAETAVRCDAIVFVNALCETEIGWRNTTYAFNRHGEIVGKYFKKHLPPSELYDLALDSAYTREFSEPYILTIDGIRFAFLTCYDFYFYEAFAQIARYHVDIIIGCSLQRSDTHDALETMTRFCAYQCNAYVLRSSVSLGADSPVGGTSMIIAPDGRVMQNMMNTTGLASAEFDVSDKYYKPAGFGNPPAPHYEYVEFGRNPWQYRNAGSAIVKTDALMPYPRVCAHRGFSTVAPENSLPAFGAAVSLGAEEIEFDLWYTKDGEIVSIHDPVLDRVSDGHGYIFEHTYEELLALDFGSKFSSPYKGLKIVKFEEILQKYAGHVILNIHIKPHGENYNREIFRQIIDLIDRYDCRRHVYIMGETDDLLALSKELAPDIPRCVGFQGEDVDMVDVALRFDCKKIQLYRPYFDQDYVDRAHANGIICNVFWSDEEELTEKYLDMGIDTILSNDYWSTAQIVERYKKEHLL